MPASRKATILLDVDTQEARVQLSRVEGNLESVEEQSEETQNALTDLSRSRIVANQQIAKARKLEGALSDVEVQAQQTGMAVSDVDADTDADVDRDRRRLPGELKEITDAARLFGSLSLKTQALIGATGAAAAALGTAGGLAAVATGLASKFGSRGLRQDIDRLQTRFRGVATTFSDEFAPIIRNQVLPAGRSFASFLQSTSDELATFTATVIELTTGLKSEQSAIRGGASQATKLGITGTGQTAVSTSLEPRRFEPQFGAQQSMARALGIRLPTDAELNAVARKVKGKIIKPFRAQASAIRDRIAAGRISQKKGLQQLLQLREKLDRQLEVFQAKLPTGLQSAVTKFIQRNRKGLKRFGRTLDALERKVQDLTTKTIRELVPSLQPATAVSPAGTVPVGSGAPTTQDVMSNVPTRIRGIPNATQRVAELRREMQRLNQVSIRVGHTLGSALARGISTLTRSLIKGKSPIVAFGKLVGSLFQRLGQAFIAAGIAKQSIKLSGPAAIAAGAALVAAGAAISSLVGEISGGGGGQRPRRRPTGTPATGGTGAQITTGVNVPGRATGGPVTAGRAYMVGERGPELMVPSADGTVIPNSAMGPTAPPEMNVNVQASGTIEAEDFDVATLRARLNEVESEIQQLR